jgi:hypothetical protein
MMRYVLGYLTEDARTRAFDPEHWHPLHVIAWCYRRDEMTRAAGTRPPAYMVETDYVEVESLRRAIRTLEKAGRVETCQKWHHDWPEAGGLHCRLTADGLASLSVCNSPTLSLEEAGASISMLASALSGRAS